MSRRHAVWRRIRSAGRRRFRDAVRDVLEDVEPRDALLREQDRRLGLRLLQNRREDVADLGVLPLRALHVHDRGLQDPAECRRLFRFVLLSARERFDRFVEVRVQAPSELRKIRPAGAEDALAVGIMCQRIQQMLQGEIRVPAGNSLAERNVEDDFNGGGKHSYQITSSFLNRRPQWITGLASERRHLVGLRLGHFPGIDAGNPAAVQVDVHHDPIRLGR